MNKVIIFHNPACSKSRQALQLLLNHNLTPEIINYQKQPLNQKQIKLLLKMLALTPRDLLRKTESIYKTLSLDNPKLTNQELIAAMAKHPILIERPIVVINNKAIIGRPPEKVLDLLAGAIL